jgi:hypothetical protein
MEVASLGGHKVLFGTVCGHAGWVLTEPAKQKSAAPAILDLFHTKIRKLGFTLTVLRADNDTVFQSVAFRGKAHQLDVDLQFSAPYTPEQLGMMERMWYTIINMTRALLQRASLPKTFWVLAARCATYLINRLHSEAAGDIPWCILHPGKQLDLSHLRIFGCAAYVIVPPTDRKKLDNKASLHVFVGYSEESKTWLVWDPSSRVLKTTMHCTFDEGRFPASEWGLPGQTPLQLPLQLAPLQPVPTGVTSVEAASEVASDLAALFAQQDQTLAAPATDLAVHCLPKFATPTTMKSLLNHPQEQEWREAVEAEATSLREYGTFVLVPCPPGANVLRCKVVFKAKLDCFGNVQRFKARVVTLGCSQRPGTDFDGQQLYAPVCAYSSMRLMLSLACGLDWDIHDYDVSTAFLNARLPEEIYMEQPPDAWGAKPVLDSTGRPLVCLLFKSL